MSRYVALLIDNLSYIEHIFEISRRPDLLTRVIEYRTTVLKISEDDEIDTKLTRIPSAKKYKGVCVCVCDTKLTRIPSAKKNIQLLLRLYSFFFLFLSPQISFANPLKTRS